MICWHSSMSRGLLLSNNANWPLAASALLLGPQGASCGVRAWQDSIMLETYAEGPPEITPVLEAFSRDTWWYPYASRTNLLSQRAPVSWRRLNLENEYLACSFLPDLGGRLYSCTDKLNNRPMFYTNPSIKKAPIAIRGARVAAGIEPNFPVAHSRDTVSPVNSGIEQGKDYGAVWLENRDRVTGMRWRVEFVLRDGSAVLEERVNLSNPTAVRAPYFWWNNAEIPLEPATRFVVPTHLMATHGITEIDTWPASRAHGDQSIVAKLKSGTALFAHGSHEPFMAVYDAGARTATVHFADAAQVPGKKIWAWGTEADSQIRQMLSDDNGQYVEMQAGLFENQETYEFLGPQERRSFTEYWMAARELGGVSRVTRDAILNLERKRVDGAPVLVVELDVTHAIHGARVRIWDGTTAVLDETADLEPRSTFSRQVKSPAAGAAYRFELADQGGQVLLAHTEGGYDAMKPSEVRLGKQEQKDWGDVSSEADYLARGNFNELNSHFLFARGDYRDGMEKFPASAGLKKAAGRLAAMQDRFAEGEHLLTEAAAGLPEDAEARYYLGVAEAGLGKEAEARKNWARVEGDHEFGPAALVEEAESEARNGQLGEALAPIRKALEKRGGLVRAGGIEVALLRRLGKADEARARAAAWRAVDPVDPFLQVEENRLGGKDETVWAWLGADAERVLDVADEYLDLGMYREAIELLERSYPKPAENQADAGAERPEENPLVAYYRGYCRRKLGESAAEDFRKASSMRLEYVFPNRASSFAVLRAALEANPGDASAHWLLGLLDINAGMADEAIGEWQKAWAARKDIPALTAVLGEALLKIKKDDSAAVVVLKGGLDAEPDNPGLLNALDAAIARAGTGALTRSEIAQIALLWVAAGDVGKGQGLFNGKNFPEEKQPNDVRQAYIEVQMQGLRSLAVAHRCDAVIKGLDAIGDVEDKNLAFTLHSFDGLMKGPRFQYYLGDLEYACGDDKAAHKRWSKVAKAEADPETADFAFPALAAGRLEQPARQMLETDAAAVARLLAASPAESRGILLYTQGLLLYTLGQQDKARAAFQEGAKAPNANMSRYLSLLALWEARRSEPAAGK